ncbi:MAG: AraC family transcriptional regulator [Caulobacter sp.]|nr:AraC family transcriptional regulator [Caulobacter sp.]
MTQTPSDHHSPRLVALIGFDGVQSLDLIGPMEVFAIANSALPEGQPPYRVILASAAGGDIVSNAGLRMAGMTPVADLPEGLDTIVVAGGGLDGLVREINDTELVAWLKARAPVTRRVASVCSGAFVLAAAGFLDGRRATTHWNSCELLAQFRPAVRVESDAIFVAEPPFYTSAGVTAGVDLCLALVEDDCGAATALAVARHLVLFMRRPGGQSQFSAGQTVQTAATPRLRALTADIVADPTGDLTLPTLAARAGMTERTFSRSFAKEVGDTPAAFVERARVDRAKALLETADWPLARVAERSGFNSLDALHRAFQKRVSATPGDYRARFGARR